MAPISDGFKTAKAKEPSKAGSYEKVGTFKNAKKINTMIELIFNQYVISTASNIIKSISHERLSETQSIK